MGFGRKISSMDSEKMNGQMGVIIKVSIVMETKKDMESINGVIETGMLENGWKISLMVSDFSLGMMSESILGSGRTIL